VDRKVRRNLFQRIILGLLLFMGAALFTWIQNEPLVEPAYFNTAGLPVAEMREGITEQPFNFDVIGLEDIIFATPRPTLIESPEYSYSVIPEESASLTRPAFSSAELTRLMNFDYLLNRLYVVDTRTALLPSDIDVYAFMHKDLRIDNTVSGPKVLVFHTHSDERFIDSNPNNPMSGVLGVGQYLAQILTEQYGIKTMHHTGRYDILSGRSHRPGSYERMEPSIRQILADNPSIQMVIDLHRDGVHAGRPPFIAYVDGVRMAQIMFVNGISRQWRDGQLTAIHHLPNPYLRDNLAFSFQLQLTANQLFPGFTRRIYIHTFRFSQHMMPLSILVEVGNQYNTKQEALNAMEPLARTIASVILP